MYVMWEGTIPDFQLCIDVHHPFFCFGNFNPKFTARRKLIVVKRFLCFLYYDRKSIYPDIRKRKDGA